jgi:beta-phosphoglucomutase-like phosphatase (HAD superfamily)
MGNVSEQCSIIMAGLVVEDAPLGLLAGRAAGAHTLAVCTSHTREEIAASGSAPDFIVDNLTRYGNTNTVCPLCHAD